MKSSKKTIFQTILVGAFVLALTVACWFKPATDYSVSERKPLEQFPTLSIDTVFNAAKEQDSFMYNFKEYTEEQFPLRDTFRRIKAMSAYYLYGLSDNNGYYIEDGYISKMDHQILPESIDYACGRLEQLYTEKLEGKVGNVYVSIIPDKNSLTASQSGHLSFDNDAFVQQVCEKMPYATYIDIMPLLSADDYYATDTHWRQEAIVDVTQKLTESMGTSIPDEYTTQTSETPFYGVYYGHAAMPVEPDTLHWLTNDTINGLTAFNHGTNAENTIYDLEKLDGIDPYELFLSGGKTAPITITNPNATTDKELIVYRDSFGSSIAPLLAQGYKTITLIDLRETFYSTLDQITDVEGKDVLFLYSTLVLNNNIEGGERFK